MEPACLTVTYRQTRYVQIDLIKADPDYGLTVAKHVDLWHGDTDEQSNGDISMARFHA